MRRSVRHVTVVLAVGVVAALVAPAGTVSPATATVSTARLASQTLPDGKKVVPRWNPCQIVTYKINPYVFPTAAQEARAAKEVGEAFRRLAAATGMKFRYTGLTTQIPRNTSAKRWHQAQTSAEIVVAWVDQTRAASKSDLLSRKGSGYAAGTGGFAYKYWKTSGAPWKGATGRGFVVLDVKQDKKFVPGYGSGVTRGSLLMHELGHTMGLLHVDATSQTMYPTVLKRSTTKYYTGDAWALNRVGRAGGCVTTPSWVWKDLK